MPSNLPKETSGIKSIKEITEKNIKLQKERSKSVKTNIGNITLISANENDIVDLHWIIKKIPSNKMKDLQIIRCTVPILYDPVFKKGDHYDEERKYALEQGFIYRDNVLYLNPDTNINMVIKLIGFHIYTNLPLQEKEEWKIQTQKEAKEFCNYFHQYITNNEQQIASECVPAYDYFKVKFNG